MRVSITKDEELTWIAGHPDFSARDWSHAIKCQWPVERKMNVQRGPEWEAQFACDQGNARNLLTFNVQRRWDTVEEYVIWLQLILSSTPPHAWTGDVRCTFPHADGEGYTVELLTDAVVTIHGITPSGDKGAEIQYSIAAPSQAIETIVDRLRLTTLAGEPLTTLDGRPLMTAELYTLLP